MKVQVKEGYYNTKKYSSLERFISYFYQIDSLKKNKGDKILFIGVGDGLVPYYLRQQGFSVTTFDFDASLNPDIVGDVRSLPFQDDDFDIVVAFEVLEHIPFEDFPKSLEEISRVTKGSAIVSVPYRHTGFELIFKLPFIRTFFKRDFLQLFLRIPIRFPGFEVSGQHYWEIDSQRFNIRRVRKVFLEHFKIIREFSPILHRYQKFFVLKKNA